jgi:class 3 adenylate cyclase
VPDATGKARGRKGQKKQSQNRRASSGSPSPFDSLDAARIVSSVRPEMLEALRRAATIPPETLEAFRKASTRMASAISPETLQALRKAATISPGTLDALRRAATIPPETLEAFRSAAARMASAISPESLKAIRGAVAIQPETLEALRRAASIPPETLESLQRASRLAIALQFPAPGEAAAAERYMRALRNAAVHAEVGERSKEYAETEATRTPPAPKSAREQRVQRMSPPALWPNSRAARRVRKAAVDRRQTDVVVLAADIRHSTDLMNDALDQYVFAATLEAFVASSRDCVWRNQGWFANFTGDGFLAFWPTTEPTRNRSVGRALRAISELFAEFESVHIPRFASNARQYREDTGLSIGLDHGNIAVVEVGDGATIVGRPVVGATRLVSPGYEWEVLANNHLGEYLTAQVAAGELQGVDIKQVTVATKEAQALRAYSIEYEWTQRPLHSR